MREIDVEKPCTDGEKFSIEIARNLSDALRATIKLNYTNTLLNQHELFRSIMAGGFYFLGRMMELLYEALDDKSQAENFFRECTILFDKYLNTLKEANNE